MLDSWYNDMDKNGKLIDTDFAKEQKNVVGYIDRLAPLMSRKICRYILAKDKPGAEEYLKEMRELFEKAILISG